MLVNLLFGGALIILAFFLIARNAVAKKNALKYPLGETEVDFLQRQHRRRLQANAMLGFVGIAIIGSTWVKGTVNLALFWLAVMLIVVWIALLAVADMISTRQFFSGIQTDQVTEHAQLMKELREVTQANDQDRNGSTKET